MTGGRCWGKARLSFWSFLELNWLKHSKEVENKILTLGGLKVFLARDLYLQIFEIEQLITICFEIRMILLSLIC